MADESFHELQPKGKQLVFLFMAATVVAVVIFLCGIMVGRGVRAQRGELIAAGSTADPTADIAPAPSAPMGNASGASPAANETLSYPDRLSADAPAPEALSEPDPTVMATPAGRKTSPAVPPAQKPNAVPEAAGSDVPAGDGFSVQVAAIRERPEAERMARRLASKGYPAYVSPPAAGAPQVFRVRVGKFTDRREAESVAIRLEKEEQFRPWVTR